MNTLIFLKYISPGIIDRMNATTLSSLQMNSYIYLASLFKSFY